MARLRDIKVGMKVEIVKGSGNPDFFTTANIGLSGLVVIIDNNDSLRSVFVGFPKRPSEWYPASWIKIIKDEGENKLTKAQTKTEVKLQTYFLEDGDGDISEVLETYDIKGLSKAEAIALLLLLSKSNGDYAYNIYYALDKSLKMNNQIDSHISFSVPTIDLHSVRHEINKLAEE